MRTHAHTCIQNYTHTKTHTHILYTHTHTYTHIHTQERNLFLAKQETRRTRKGFKKMK